MVHHQSLDSAFAALADPVRRAVLERLGAGPASVSELAAPFDMTLTGMKKHVAVRERAQMVTTEKVGRTRICRAGPRNLEDVLGWVELYRDAVVGRMDRFADVLEQRRGTT